MADGTPSLFMLRQDYPFLPRQRNSFDILPFPNSLIYYQNNIPQAQPGSGGEEGNYMAMPTPKLGSVVHVEFVSKEPEKTKKFYNQIFGWKFQEMPELNYSMVDSKDTPGGGLRQPGQGEGPGTLSYVLVESIEETVSRAKAAGAHVLMAKQEIPNMGWMAVFVAPGGVVQGIFEANPEAQM
jgi:predicted enzyme related to lactoylglutathione lyase